MTSTYLVALGSNRRHHLYGRPREVVRAAMEELAAFGTVRARSAIVITEPLGPAQRRFANAAALVASEYDPPAILTGLKRLERQFGRRATRRWGDRVLDCDLILWSGGQWAADALTIPHPEFRKRGFVLGPASAIAPDFRDPISGLSLAQLNARLTHARALPR